MKKAEMQEQEFLEVCSSYDHDQMCIRDSTWFMSQKTFDGKKPYSFLKSQITYALRPKITYAGKTVKLHKQILNETITAVRSVNYVPRCV